MDSGIPRRFHSQKKLRDGRCPYDGAKHFTNEMAGVNDARGKYVNPAMLYSHEFSQQPRAFVARAIAKSVE